MNAGGDIPPYLPHFLFKYWLSDKFATPRSPDDQRFHVYDVHNNDLAETRRIPHQARNIFEDFITQEVLDEHCQTALSMAEMAFSRLEAKAELTYDHLMQQVLSSRDSHTNRRASIPMESHELETLRRFFLFVRYRNSARYGTVLSNLVQTVTWKNRLGHGVLLPVWHRIRRHRALTSIHAFLNHSTIQQPAPAMPSEDIDRCCWALLDAEVCLGVASEGQEFVMTDKCIGNLDECFRGDPDSCRFFVPLSPTVAIYILGDLTDEPVMLSSLGTSADDSIIHIECGVDSVSDVHLRNAVLLQDRPQHIYFSNLQSISRTINLYHTGSRDVDEHSDYSRLMHRCQQKATQEQVTKTLLVKGSIFVTDLTEHVVRLGDSPVALGSFSDVWKGIWTIEKPFGETEHRTVALKYLRQVMSEIVRTKLINRLKAEVAAWHSLRHENIAELFGVIQSCNTIAMISPWCNNGTLVNYLKEVNTSANRLELLVQIASGVSYLHNFKPVVIHGDLKGCNVLVDDHGNALITDFGLAKVIEEFSDSMQLTTSFFAGSTRWMAPELILALVEDDDRPPPITTYSDVYSFACVCLEIATDKPPFPHRTNDHAVTVDIMRGVRPSRGASCHFKCYDEEGFWGMLDQCWDPASYLRPTMSEVTAFMRAQNGSPANYVSRWLPHSSTRPTLKY